MLKLILAISLLGSLHCVAETPHGAIVIETASDLQENIQENIDQLVRTFKTEGPSAVADTLKTDLSSPQSLEAWRDFVRSGEVRVVEVKVHPNEMKALEWMNFRFKRMGLPNLQLKGLADESVPDPTSINDRSIRGKKWLRYAAGPGIAAIAAFFGLPQHSGMSAGDFLYLVIPAAGVGVTTVALELQFSWPWLNNRFWNKVWRLGGAVGGRLSNLVVNFLYGMTLYGAGVGSAHLPMLFGDAPVPFDAPTFTQAVTRAAVGAVIFHLAMGQFQTDIATEQDRGSITANDRYGLETTGSVVNNSARVAGWVDPGNGSYYGYFAQAGFFLLKTFPQLLKTHVADVLNDREVHRQVNPENAPGATVFEKCARTLATLNLVNLPAMRREGAP